MSPVLQDDVWMLDTLADELEQRSPPHERRLLYGTSMTVGYWRKRTVIASTAPSAGLIPVASLSTDVPSVPHIRQFGPRKWGFAWSRPDQGPFFTILPWRSVYGARSTGLADTDVLGSKRVGVVGLGSVGSLAALLLAKANVGHLVLLDGDAVATENLLRTIYLAMHLGAPKVDAASELIAQANPGVMVEAHRGELRDVLERHPESFEGLDLIVIAASSAVGSELAARFHRTVPMIFPGLHARAASGEIFVSGGARHAERPCFSCFRAHVPPQGGAARSFKYGGSAHELQAEPGLGADITHVVSVAASIALHLLAGHPERVVDFERQLLLTTHRHGALFERSFETAWVKVPRDADCPNHTEHAALTGAETDDLIASIPEVSP